MNMRRLRMGLKTVLGFRKEGFFIPYRYAASLPDAVSRRPYPAIEEMMAANEARFAAMLGSLAAFATDFAAIGTAPPPEPRFEQDWFPRLDAMVAYAMVRMKKPARISEWGTVHYTRIMSRAIRDGRMTTDTTICHHAHRPKL